MQRITRQRHLPLGEVKEMVLSLEAEEEPEDVLEEGEEPEYERKDDESCQEAQNRIEEKYRARATSPLRAIRAFCVLCMGAQPKEVAKCTAKRCVLYRFRDGRNPFQKHTKKVK